MRSWNDHYYTFWLFLTFQRMTYFTFLAYFTSQPEITEADIIKWPLPSLYATFDITNIVQLLGAKKKKGMDISNGKYMLLTHDKRVQLINMSVMPFCH